MAPYVTALNAFTMEGGANLLSFSESVGFFRVFQVPNWQPEFQGATADGFTFVTVDYTDYTDLILDTEVLVDGQPTDFAERNTRTFSGTTYDGTDIYFDRINNGTHQYQLLTTIRLDNVISEIGPTPTLTFTSKVVSASVANVILFTNWEDSAIGSTTTFEAFSTIPNVDWTIEVYDVVDDFVISHSGHSTDGRISWTWDLYDFLGTLRNDWEYDPIFQPYVTITPPGFQPAASTTAPMPKKALDYPLFGKWLVVYQDREKRPDVRQDFLDTMEAIAGGPALWESLYGSLMLNYGPEYTQTQRKQTWIQFRNALTQSPVRNLYYQGHGSADWIGGDVDVTNKNGEITGTTVFPGVAPVNEITTDWVEKNLTKNNREGYRHFRFVFLDGCETAKGKWPQAFGVPKSTNTLAYYTASGRKPNSRPSAFVGWEEIVGGSRRWGTADAYALFRTEWMFQWASQFTDLDEAFTIARNNTQWITLAVMNGALRIYGYNDLGFQDYDSRGQWPGP